MKLAALFFIITFVANCAEEMVFVEPDEVMKEVVVPANYTGAHIAYYSNKQKKAECIYINGKKEGVEIKYFWRSGRIMSTYTYVNGVLNGEFSKFEDNSQSTCFAKGYYYKGKPYQGTFDYDGFISEFCKDTYHYGQIDLGIITVLLKSGVEIERYSMNKKRPKKYGEVGSLLKELKLFKDVESEPIKN